MAEYLFSYGTLQSPEVQVRLFGRSLGGSADVLPGYRAVSIEVSDPAFLASGEDRMQMAAVISEYKRDLIEGTVFELTDAEMRLADQYEPAGYVRRKVTLGSGKEAWMYTAAKIT